MGALPVLPSSGWGSVAPDLNPQNLQGGFMALSLPLSVATRVFFLKQ